MKPSVVAALFALAAGIPQAASATDWTLTFSTYFGGSDMTTATAVAVDGIGNIYVTGWTDSTTLPGCNPTRPNAGGVDAFVAKWDGATHRIDYCTFLGGRGDDRSFAIAVDGSGYAYITGWTTSANFPVSMPLQVALAGAENAFVAKLNPAGVLVYSSYLGGNGSDSGNAIAVDSAGNMTVVGSTTSTKFPLANPIQSRLNGQTNVFVTRLNPAGNLLVYSTYLGGNGNDYGTAVALDGTGAAYLTGSTTSTNFPTVSAFQPASGGNQDAFVAKINGAGNDLVYSTYLGGSGGTVGFPETGTGIAVNSAGDAYVTGNTSSQNFPLANALFSASAGVGMHAFVAELNPAGNELLYSTYLGSSSVDQAAAIAVDSSGNIVAVGYTASPDFPVTDAVQASLAGGYDAFVTRLNSTGTALLGSTFFGGSGSDAANAVAYAASDAIYVAGQTQSLNLPLENATQSALAGAQNAFLAVYAVPVQVSAPAAPAGLAATAGSGSVLLNWTNSSGASSYNVYRGTAAGSESTTAIATGIAGTTYSDNGLNNGTKYYYKVAAINGGGISALSAEASATPEPTAPAAPAGLAATAGSGSVTLNWTASSGATSYNVYRGTAAGSESTTAIATGIANASYADNGLSNGTTYYYKVAAVNGGGTSPLSAEVSATPQPSAPAAPTGLTATAGSGSVTLNWTASSGATSYNVYRGTSAAGESTTAIVTGITSVSYSDTGLTNGTKYYYKVAAVNAGGTSPLSAEASATPEPSAPAAPTGLTATAGSGSVTLNWTASSGATSYNVYRGTTAGGESTSAIVTGITSASYSDTGLTNGTKYYYKVAAVNAGGTSALSAEASATPQPSAPAAPIGLTATAGSGSVTLNWTASSGATSYNVYRGTAAGSESTTAIVTGNTSAAYSDTGLTNGTRYYYKVAAVNGGGTSALSAEASATPQPSAPAAPTGLAATAGNASVALNWTASSGATSYSVYRGTALVTNFVSVAEVTVSIPATLIASGGTASVTVVNPGGAMSAAATFTINQPVQAVSVSPFSGSGLQQAFTFHYSDNAGATDLSTMFVWFNPSFSSATNSCLVEYSRPANTLYLMNNADTAWSSATVGSSGALANSQCSVNAASASMSLSGTGLTLSLPVTFASTYSGTMNVYSYAAGSAVNSGWQTIGTWTISTSVVSVNANSVSPASGSGLQQTFTLNYSDSAGATDLATTFVWFNANSSNTTNSCQIEYNRSANTLYLLNDVGTAWSSASVGSSATLANSQCSVNAASANMSLSGTGLTLSLPVTFASTYSGTINIYSYAAGSAANSGWQTLGTWTVPTVVVGVNANSVSPASGSGLQQTFTLHYSDGAGATDLSTMFVWFNPSFSSATNSCLVEYSRPANTLYLMNNADTAWSSATVGSSGALANSQCSLNAASASVSLSGTGLTLSLPVTFVSTYSGTMTVYSYAAGSAVNSGWQTLGTWMVP
jgi:fibronectin type 3 domain-containing protein